MRHLRCFSACLPAGRLLRPVQRAELVAVRISHVSQVQGTQLAITQTRRVLDRRTALRDRRVVELTDLFRRAALEPDGRAVAEGGRLAIDRLTDAERAPVVPIEQAFLSRGVLVPGGLAYAEHPQNRVVEAPGALDVVGPDHHVTEHRIVSCCLDLAVTDL